MSEFWFNQESPKKAALRKLIEKAKALGRLPTSEEVDNDPDLPSVNEYARHYGRFELALAEAAREIGIRYLVNSDLPSTPDWSEDFEKQRREHRNAVESAEAWRRQKKAKISVKQAVWDSVSAEESRTSGRRSRPSREVVATGEPKRRRGRPPREKATAGRGTKETNLYYVQEEGTNMDELKNVQGELAQLELDKLEVPGENAAIPMEILRDMEKEGFGEATEDGEAAATEAETEKAPEGSSEQVMPESAPERESKKVEPESTASGAAAKVKRYTTDEALSALRKAVAENNGAIPSQMDYGRIAEAHNLPTWPTLVRKLGPWKNWLAILGGTMKPPGAKPSKDQLPYPVSVEVNSSAGAQAYLDGAKQRDVPAENPGTQALVAMVQQGTPEAKEGMESAPGAVTEDSAVQEQAATTCRDVTEIFDQFDPAETSNAIARIAVVVKKDGQCDVRTTRGVKLDIEMPNGREIYMRFVFTDD